MPLLFSKRTTTAVTVFLCLSVSRDAWRQTTNVAQISALHLVHAQLFSIYRQVRHQDIANQAAVLATIITKAQTAIVSLNATVQAIAPTLQNSEELPGLQLICENAVQVMVDVQAAEG